MTSWDLELLAALQCPHTKTKLSAAESGLIEQVNQAIAGGIVRNMNLQTVERSLDGGLLNQDGSLLYPVYGRIVFLMAGDALPLNDLFEAEIHRPPAASIPRISNDEREDHL